MRYLKYILIIFLLNQSNVNALIEVDITRGNLNPLPIAVSSLSIEKTSNEELQKISFDIEDSTAQIKVFFEADKLVETLHFVIVAAEHNKHEIGYGRFMNQVEKAIHGLCEELAINKQRQDLSVRFFQHISYPY